MRLVLSNMALMSEDILLSIVFSFRPAHDLPVDFLYWFGIAGIAITVKMF